MATFAPARLVKGAARQPLPFGLFSVLNFTTPDDPHWQAGGVTWEVDHQPDTLGTVGFPTGELPPPEEGEEDTRPESGQPSSGLPKAFDREPLVGRAYPFSVYGHSKATALAYTQEEAQFRALEHLTAFEETQVEQAFWAGEARPFLDDSTEITDLPITDNSEALAELEQFIVETYGSRGVIHMSRKDAMMLMDEGLEVKGSMLTTELGTPVVAGSGYTSGTVKATPALFGYRSEVFYSSQAGSPLLDVKNNDMYAIAERTYLIGFDPTGIGSVTLS